MMSWQCHHHVEANPNRQIMLKTKCVVVVVVVVDEMRKINRRCRLLVFDAKTDWQSNHGKEEGESRMADAMLVASSRLGARAC